MIFGKASVAFLLFFGIISSNYGQDLDFDFKRFTTEDGLVDNHILDLQMDLNGNLWIAGKTGLCFFDGIRFEKFPLLSKNKVYIDIERDYNGNLWLKCENMFYGSDSLENLLILNPTTKEILDTKKYLEYVDPTFLFSNVWNIKANSEGEILLISDDRIFFFRNQKIEYVGISDCDGISVKNNSPNSLICSDGFNVTYHYLDNDTDTTFTFRNRLANLIRLDDNEYYYLAESDHSNDLRSTKFGFTNSLSLFSKYGDELGSNIQALFQYTYDSLHLIVSSSQSLNIVERHSQKSYNMFPLLVDKIPNTYITGIERSGLRNIWLATNNGLINFSFYPRRFKSYLNGKRISTRGIIQPDSTTLWIASYSGIHEYNFEQSEITTFQKKNSFYTWSQIDSNTYYIGRPGRLLNEWHDYELTTIALSPGLGVSMRIPHLSSNNEIWVGSTDGLLIFNVDENEAVPKEFVNGKIISNVHAIYFDSKNEHAYIGTSDGVVDIDIANDSIKFTEEISEYTINFIYQDVEDSDVFWMGSRINGLIRWNRGTKEVLEIGRAQGLSNQSVHAIYEDSHRRLWISTDYGLNIYSKETGEIQNFFEEDGLHVNEFNSHSSCRLVDSTLIFGSIDGLVHVDPNEFNSASDGLNDLLLTNIQVAVDGVDSTLMLSIDKDDFGPHRIKSTYKSPQLIFNTGVDQINKKETYRFFISNHSDPWQFSKSNVIELGDLKYGEHEVIIEKKIGINKWSTPKHIALEMMPPFFLRDWFLGISTFLSVLILFYYQNYSRLLAEKKNLVIQKEVDIKTEDLQKSNMLLKEANSLNDQIFTIIAHDLRSPVVSFVNTSKKLNYLIENQEIDRLNSLGINMDSHASNLLEVIENLLSWAQLQKEDERPQLMRTNLSSVVSAVINTYNDRALLKGIELKFDPGLFYIETDRSTLQIIISNLLSNCIKFSPSGSQISILITNQNGTKLIMTDQSGGIEAHVVQKIERGLKIESTLGTSGEKGLGLGLTICTTLIKRIGGKLEIQSKRGEGSTFILEL